ncbi:Translationally-controlled tumor protein-like protein [Talaromyces atroroseus]|uniref:Translationally-controlled tumor protein homolog n=1 Tax=Talaromyces atroroseus TaxID=1441469 RepID=A0A225ANN9_TALAT|nr:Translationally-controlled tumor protein-like protein [Talaromyces atroroseus]OKL56045.1 Translationally-controlled tumor protein-like protein [Talaromyces atroroseus]
MIIYKDIISGDEIISDTFNLKEEGPVLWTADCRKYLKGSESFQLEGANPSAEGGDEDEGGEGAQTMVHDIEDQFRLVWLKTDEGMKPSKEAYKSHLKTYVKAVNNKLKEKGASEETIKEFQSGAAAAVKKILGNYDNYDVLMGQSMDGNAMHVLIDFRDDGVTPFATVWKHGLEEMKV